MWVLPYLATDVRHLVWLVSVELLVRIASRVRALVDFAEPVQVQLRDTYEDMDTFISYEAKYQKKGVTYAQLT